MLLLEKYFFCASLRLGVIIIGIFAALKSIALIFIFGINGVNVLDDIFERMQENAYYKTNVAVKRTVNWMESDPTTILLLVQLFNVGHITAAFMGIYGALKLKKWFVPPLIFFEGCYFTHVITVHIVIMIMLKKLISLIMLIVFTIIGGSYVLLVLYDCVALLAFIQAVMLVESPFKPVLRQPKVVPPSNCSLVEKWATRNTKMLPPNYEAAKANSKLWLVGQQANRQTSVA